MICLMVYYSIDLLLIIRNQNMKIFYLYETLILLILIIKIIDD